MSTIISDSEQLRRALRWISSERETRPKTGVGKLIDEAALQFDLSPAEQEWLLHTLTQPVEKK